MEKQNITSGFQQVYKTHYQFLTKVLEDEKVFTETEITNRWQAI